MGANKYAHKNSKMVHLCMLAWMLVVVIVDLGDSEEMLGSDRTSSQDDTVLQYRALYHSIL